MLSGSLALNIYTTPRMTRGIAIVIALQERNLSDFLDCFPEDSFYRQHRKTPSLFDALWVQGVNLQPKDHECPSEGSLAGQLFLNYSGIYAL
jgi:hypothetical protein